MQHPVLPVPCDVSSVDSAFSCCCPSCCWCLSCGKCLLVPCGLWQHTW